MPMLESVMEEQLIAQLIRGESQWTYRKDINCEEKLWANLREKLNNNNLDQLNGVLITDAEMEQIKLFIRDQATTTYSAARWLAGEHGIAQIPLIREDASLGKISLTAINNREIAGGNSCYEVINQYRSPEDKDSDRARRFDVTLLINGLPMIAIELKNSAHGYNEAFNQLLNYSRGGKFHGLMGLVQMFVVTNGSGTRYIAANNQGDLNPKFLVRWVNEKNEPVEDYIGFAKAALNIPMAHQMVGKYSVLDNARKKVILLRPYQIHAIEAIRKASRDRRSGYVWHTTGSGKTLTSYTVTKNLLDIPSIDKTIFLVDRRDLDQQTSDAFLSYAESSDIDIEDTDNTTELVKKLKDKNRSAIVTTIQKLQCIIRWCTGERATEAGQKLAKVLGQKSIAFVVDECHRAVTPETKRSLESFFGRSLWYGFTGTPIFDENKRAAKGDLPQTTGGLFYTKAEWEELQKNPNHTTTKRLENCLHIYSIKEAIHDQSVLGFNFQGMGHDRDQFIEFAKKLNAATDDELSHMETWEIEQAVISQTVKASGKDFYDTDKHREEVVNYIVNRAAQKLNVFAPDGQAFEGLLTVSSIREAQIYYKLFKKFKEEGKVKESIRNLLPDYPRVAITYTVGVNQDGALANQDEMKEALADYNALFKTSWSLDMLGAYNNDLNQRLARKSNKFSDRDLQLDIVIVVDRLLTGFDAPCLSTIFIDRPPMKPEHLIQAFSRTNRIFPNKSYGQVVSMRTPALFEKRFNEALVIYSNSNDADIEFVKAPTWEVISKKAKEAADELHALALTPKAVEQLTQPLETAPQDVLVSFVKAFQAADRAVAEARVYDQYDSDTSAEQLGVTSDELNEYAGYYQNIVAELRRRADKGTEPEKSAESIDIDYALECVKQIEVNFKYLVTLIQAYMPEDRDAPRQVDKKEDERIKKFIDQYRTSNPRVAEVMDGIWTDIKANPEAFRNRDAHNIIMERIHARIDEGIAAFAKKWCVNEPALRAFALYTSEQEIKSSAVNTNMTDFKAYKAAGGEYGLNRLKYHAAFRKAVCEFVLKDVRPFLKL